MHAPASTFEHKGKQYVLAFSAGSALLGSARGDSVWLFGLDGTLPPARRPVAPVLAATRRPPPTAGSVRQRRAARLADANLVDGQRSSRRRAPSAMATTARAATASARRSPA